MKNKVLALAILAMGFSAKSFAQTNNATATASAIIVQAITISKTSDMNFGQIVADGTEGTVVLALDGTVTSPSLTLPNGIATSAASFDVTGAPDAYFTVTASSDATLTDGGSNTMGILYSYSEANLANCKLSSGGSLALTVGGTLTVGAGQAAGAYTGTIDLTVAYN